MKNNLIKRANSSFTRQIESSDCGCACLLSLIKFYNGENTLEKIRELSGTDQTGTTLLGLYQTACYLGFNAQGCEADIDSLIEHNQPLILHITKETNIQHYVVCYGYINNHFIIGDPSNNELEFWDKEKLNQLWKSKKCLTLSPNKRFQISSSSIRHKKAWIKRLLIEDSSILISSIVIGIFISLLGLTMAIFSQKLIDEILPSHEYTKLWISIILLTILLLTRIGLIALRKLFLFRQQKDFSLRTITTFYNKLLFLPKSFYDSRNTGDLIARLNDTRRLQNIINIFVGDSIIDFLIVIISLCVLFIYSWKIGLISLILLPLLFILIYMYSPKINKAQNEVMKGYALTETNFINSIQSISTIKNFNLQKQMSLINNFFYGRYTSHIYNLGVIQVKLGLIVDLFSLIIIITILSYGSILVFKQNIKLGELMAIITICNTILPSIINLGLIVIPFNEAKVAFNRMFELIKRDTENKGDKRIESLTIHSLKIENLAFRFPGKKTFLNNLSLHLERGKIISLTGESGCGKSTLSQIISKLYEYEDGNILINNLINLKNINTEQWRDEIIGVVPQDISIFSGSVLSNIDMNLEEKNISSLLIFLEKYGFNSFFNKLPEGYNTFIGENGINLSGGQKQLIAFARALYKNPQILILDEITSAMDQQTEKFIINILMQIKKNTLIFFISHRIPIIRHISDTIYIMENGCIKNNGTHEELMRIKNNFYSNFWNTLIM